ncbi:MAG: hypothetical protein QF362_01185 [Candidatus Woesearchaeota archaeon]|jgi:hypothetical protein|nr:hypothetical protein [Candidatus Woesearchaeota archaeon]MDP7506043.1 hypothetical protein [Candidatus Woesearchaeota archaeon]MDP7610523.1 hypothetical protein [Candidatus Woesearchaeota archaeon]|tara:strand:+ start:1535 stop:1933 length:399 start_codon:yes stop_codon:yes gene_type:complete
MKIYVKDDNGNNHNSNNIRRKKSITLSSENILAYLITEEDKINTLILCKGSEYDFITTDHAVYEALGAVKPNDDFKLNKLTKFFEVVKVVSYANVFRKEKPILTEKRVEDLRNKTMKLQNLNGGNENDKQNK